ncbi:MAG: hypothetical protein GF400_04305, partial [Candidatus Eisenbacteria bacterium]|nr:hypothetical protein [Candidatus Eisenbacteria bacterium]
MSRWSWRHAAPVVAAFAANAASLPLKFSTDELHSLYWGARSLHDPSNLLRPWYGGLLQRLPAKLALMGGLLAWGPRTWAFHLLAVVTHAACAAYVGCLSERLSGSKAVGVTAGLLFAVGFGWYGKAVFRSSNETMLLGLLFLLVGVELMLRRRWIASALLLVLAVASHEITAGAILSLPVLYAHVRGSGEGGPTGSPETVRRDSG